jgi:exodeoxyribonuclease VII large subunit
MAMTKIYTVSQVTFFLKNLIEKEPELQSLWISGEISNFTLHSSGHMYFTLKDQSSRLRCVMFRGENKWLKFQPHDGLEVIVFGRIAIYPKNGEYQLYVELMEAAGLGSLYLAFEQLKNRLAEEGLFDPAKKRPLPKLPRKIGVITSPTGAAVQDIIRILHRRHPRVDILLIPAQVQGETAPESLIEAINLAGRLTKLDLLIIGRGGGSAEELWAFNNEGVARAMAACPIPTISAVGHESDFTIADLVADLRAPTPSGAAELAVPEVKEIRKKINMMMDNLKSSCLRLIERKQAQIFRLKTHPALTQPERLLLSRRQQVDEAKEELIRLINRLFEEKRKTLLVEMGKLDALSPLSTLARGYSICWKDKDGAFLRDAREINPGEKVTVVLNHGQLLCTVEETREEVIA